MLAVAGVALGPLLVAAAIAAAVALGPRPMTLTAIVAAIGFDLAVTARAVRGRRVAGLAALASHALLAAFLWSFRSAPIAPGTAATADDLDWAEAVLGAESYLFESRYTQKAAELNTVLPFTRNAVGPMDSTPVACSPKKYPRTTTTAHELATALIFTSGIIHYADKPEFFESLPAEAQQVLRDAPARWDETRCLVGAPGRVVVFARRTGKTWFIAGINGTDKPLPITLDLSPFRDFRRRLAIAEGTDPKMQVAASPLASSNSWKHELPPRGGFILRFDRE
jgi:hypothetical protein